jgi:hypothetical protein
MPRPFLVPLLILLIALISAGPVQGSDALAGGPAAAILADPGDPYYALAEEIARQEGLPIWPTLDEALQTDPAFLLWVVSPAYLSDQAMVEYGERMRGRPSSVSMGIISGTTLEDARSLWLRAAEARGEQVFAANAANPSAHIQPAITAYSPEGTRVEPLTKANLVRSLREADYLTFTGHGSGRVLRLDAETTLGSADLPALPPVVVASGNCNSFRLWEEDSLPLAFARQGAAAFAGYVYSPIEGYLLGQYSGLPFRYTWPDFPVGHALQVLNRGASQGFAALPYLHLLGDPRLALQAAPPYRLIGDQTAGSVRTLTYSGAPAGVIPVHIPGGARYPFVEIPGVSAAWQGDPFYNARLQMVDIGEDKYILFLHQGGDLELRLRLRPPWGWAAGDLLLDALDNALLFMPQTGGSWLILALAGLAAIPIGWILARRRQIRVVIPALLTGASLAAVHALYVLARLERVTLISKPVQFSPVALAGTFLWAALGTALYLSARGRLARACALLVAVLPAAIPAAVNVGFALIGNWAVFHPTLGVSLNNYHLGLQAAMAAAVECLLFGIVLAIVRRRFLRTHGDAALSGNVATAGRDSDAPLRTMS